MLFLHTAKNALFLLLLLGFVGALPAQAQTAPSKIELAIKKKLEESLKAPVKAVQSTPYNGLYEVQVEGDLIYVDKQVKYLFSGNVIDLQTKVNLTAQRQEALAQIRFDDLPLQYAIKTVNGKGSQKIAVFEDPNCGYCKRFRKILNQTADITVYTFQYNILSENSAEISSSIWCSNNPGAAWDAWMLKGEMPKVEDKSSAKAGTKCVAPHQEVLALGRKLGISGTPATYFANGKRASGALSEEGFKQALADNAR